MAAIKLSRVEILAQLVIVVSCVWISLHSATVAVPYIKNVQGYGADFRGYLDLARGNAPNHAYKQYCGYLFTPFLPIADKYGEVQAVYCWMGLLIASYMILTHFVCKVRYGWILSLVCIKPFWFSLHSGNITPILCVALLFLESAWLAVLVKPHFAVIALCVAYRARRDGFDERLVDKGPMGLSNPDLTIVLPTRKRK
jgi:hypothetical protein